ncbi:MAG: acetoacetate decarboxylase family protein [Methylocystis sp.]|nr:acetoacetate decarboxylase family protein [Methylocystis sp.]
MAVPVRQEEIRGRHAIVDGIRYLMPIDSWEASAMIALFPCDYDAAKALILDPHIHPFRYFSRALLIVTVIDYRKTDIGSYIEYSIAIACTHGRSPAPQILPAIFQKSFGTGQFVHDLPVSSEVSVKGGRGIWGMPKHQANLDFKVGRAWASSQYDLDGRMVSRFDVKLPKRAWLPVNAGAANYCLFRGMTMRSFIYFKGKAGFRLFQPGSARFILGDHPRAASLASLAHEPDPIFAGWFPNIKGVLDDYFDCWFVTTETKPDGPISEGLETTYPLGYSQDWLAPPARDPAFDLDKE